MSHLSHRELLSIGPSGLILSTDDYFVHRDGYHYELGLLGAAHEWNQSRGIFSFYAHTALTVKKLFPCLEKCLITKAFLSDLY